MKSTDRIPNYILDDIRRNVPYGREDYTDEQINEMDNFDLLDHWLNWNGIIGYTGSFLDAVKAIYDIELNERAKPKE